MAGSYGSLISNFQRKFHPGFPSGCTILHSDQECTSVPISLHPSQHFFKNTVIAILTGVKVLICISLMISGVEYFYIYLFVICMFYLEKCLFKVLYLLFSLGYLLFTFDLQEFLMYFIYQKIIRFVVHNFSLSFCRLPFHS